MSAYFTIDSTPDRAVVSWTGTASGSASAQYIARVPQALTAGTYAFTVTLDGNTLATVASASLVDGHEYSIPTPEWQKTNVVLTKRQVY
jgi:hypothetical protein